MNAEAVPGALHLTGLDGSNPLGFLAAVGLLRVLDEVTPADASRPVLWWEDSGRWLPWLRCSQTRDEVIERVVQHARECLEQEPALAFSYDDDGQADLGGEGRVRDLKPSPAGLRALQDASALAASVAPSSAVRRRSVDWMAAFGSECVLDLKGRVKPGALHFTAGQQAFLSMVRELACRIDSGMVSEALFGPWIGTRRLPNLRWSSWNSRGYAFQATNPSDEKRTSIAAADWLAFTAWSKLPSLSDGRRLRTALCSGGWKDGHLTWPLWSRACTVQTIGSLLVRGDLEDLSAKQRDALGIRVLFESKIEREDYGSFAPACVL